MDSGSEKRISRAMISLEGLSVGDAMGDAYCQMDESARMKRRLVTAPWYYTDDTVMAKALVELLSQDGTVDQDKLADYFVRNFRLDPTRGYGGGINEIIEKMKEGAHWRDASAGLYGGAGSYGNGAAMRVAPLGAYFADDFELMKQQARAQAEVTHAHVDGQDGAIAVALATGWAVGWRATFGHTPDELFRFVIDQLEPGLIRDGIEKAKNLPLEYAIETASRVLGNGTNKTAVDSVPFCLWCAARHIDNFEEAIWTTISAGGDMDTNCAIVGGIVAMSVERDGIPCEWIQSREDLDVRSFREDNQA